jgi:hypothetical protein
VPPFRVFPYLVAGGELTAGVVYAYYGEWRLAIVWIGVGIANLAFAGII